MIFLNLNGVYAFLDSLAPFASAAGSQKKNRKQREKISLNFAIYEKYSARYKKRERKERKKLLQRVKDESDAERGCVTKVVLPGVPLLE